MKQSLKSKRSMNYSVNLYINSMKSNLDTLPIVLSGNCITDVHYDVLNSVFIVFLIIKLSYFLIQLFYSALYSHRLHTHALTSIYIPYGALSTPL